MKAAHNAFRRFRALKVLEATLIALIIGMAAAHHVQAQTYTILHSFNNASNDGGPGAGVILDNAGNIYGTSPDAFHGGVFKLDPSGNELFYFHFPVTVISPSPLTYSAPYGEGSYAPLVIDSTGNLIGTACCGGADNFGTIFKLDSAGSIVTALYSFTSNSELPNSWYSGLIIDKDDNVYGDTPAGGSNECGGGGCGTVFKVDASGSYTLLYTFTSQSDGLIPNKLLRDSAGNLYGTTNEGGTSSACGNGCGTVFELVNTSGSYTKRLLYSFAGGTDGANPYAGLVMDAAGNVYGTTEYGGSGYGTVFELVNSSGNYITKVLYTFQGGSDGALPSGDLAIDAAGNLYGTTLNGGDTSLNDGYGGGVVFELDPSGKETVLHTFGSFSNDGISGEGLGGLAMDAAGNLYGTTAAGGDYDGGTVFKITLAAPAVTLSPTSFDFGSVNIGTETSAQSFTLSNSGTADLVIQTVSLGGANPTDFAIRGDTCSSQTIAPTQTCSVSVSFWPTSAGGKTASLSFADNAGNGPQTVALSGTATQPMDFTLSVTPTAQTAKAGKSASYTVFITTTYPFIGSPQVFCSGAPPASTCSISGPNPSLADNQQWSATATVNTSPGKKGTPKGTYTLTLTADWGPLSQLVSHSVNVSLTVGR